MARIQRQQDGLSSAEYAAASYGLLYSSREEAVACAQALNQYRQTQCYSAAVIQTSGGYWRTIEPGTQAGGFFPGAETIS